MNWLDRLRSRPTLPVLMIIFTNMLGFGIILPLLPFYAESFGADPATIGVLLASYSVFQLIGAPLLGRLSDRIGRRPVLIITQAGTLAGFVMLALANGLPLLFAARIIDGFTGGNIPVAQALIADVTSKEERAKAFGKISAAFGFGFVLGPALGGMLSVYGYAAPAWAAAGVAALTVLMAVVMLPAGRRPVRPVAVEPAPASRTPSRLAWLTGRPVLSQLLGLLLLHTFAFAIYQTTFALVLGLQFDFTAQQAGYLLAYGALLVIVSQLVVLPRVVRRLGERRLAIAGMTLLAAGLLLTSVQVRWEPLLGTLALISAGGSLVRPALQSLLTQVSSDGERGGVLGIASSLESAARIAAPLWGGFAIQWLGPGMPAFSAGVLAVAASLGAWLLLRQDGIAAATEAADPGQRERLAA